MTNERPRCFKQYPTESPACPPPITTTCTRSVVRLLAMITSHFHVTTGWMIATASRSRIGRTVQTAKLVMWVFLCSSGLAPVVGSRCSVLVAACSQLGTQHLEPRTENPHREPAPRTRTENRAPRTENREPVL